MVLIRLFLAKRARLHERLVLAAQRRDLARAALRQARDATWHQRAAVLVALLEVAAAINGKKS
jgi:hypothetical protein